MKVLVTGASGHIGGAIVHALVEAGHEVVVAVRGNERVQGAAKTLPFNLLDDGIADSLLRAVERCDAIVHAAAIMDPTFPNADVSRGNAGGTHQLLNVAQAWGGVSFVYISGVGVIGAPLQHPISETHPAQPATTYTASKLYGEILTRLYGESGAPAVSLRVSSPVGPGMRARRIFSIFAEAAAKGDTIHVGDPERRQDYVDVRDVAAAVVACLGTAVTGLYNIASGRAVSNLELAKTAVAALNSASHIEVSPQQSVPQVWDVSIEAARRAFGYAPRISLIDSVRDFAHSLPPAAKT